MTDNADGDRPERSLIGRLIDRVKSPRPRKRPEAPTARVAPHLRPSDNRSGAMKGEGRHLRRRLPWRSDEAGDGEQ